MANGNCFRLRVFINDVRADLWLADPASGLGQVPEADLASHLAWGWSEVYWLHTADVDTALAWAFDICNRRRLWFGVSVYTVYAEISQPPYHADTWAVDVSRCKTFPPGGAPQPLFPNDPWVSWCYIAETPGGRYFARQLRGIPDDWVHGMEPSRTGGVLHPLYSATLPPMVLDAGPNPPIILGADSLETLQRSFLDALIKYTGFITEPGAVPHWTADPLDRIGWMGVRKKNVNSAWKVVSLEGGWKCVDGHYQGPGFSFCGQILGVAGWCYSAPFRWYDGGRITCGRFYRVPESNPVYYGRLRFGPKNSEPDYYNRTNAGEISYRPAAALRTWYSGLDVWTLYPPAFAGRDGSHPDVAPEEAGGTAPNPADWLPCGPFLVCPAGGSSGGGTCPPLSGTVTVPRGGSAGGGTCPTSASTTAVPWGGSAGGGTQPVNLVHATAPAGGSSGGGLAPTVVGASAVVLPHGGSGGGGSCPAAVQPPTWSSDPVGGSAGGGDCPVNYTGGTTPSCSSCAVTPPIKRLVIAGVTAAACDDPGAVNGTHDLLQQIDDPCNWQTAQFPACQALHGAGTMGYFQATRDSLTDWNVTFNLVGGDLPFSEVQFQWFGTAASMDCLSDCDCDWNGFDSGAYTGWPTTITLTTP